MSSLTPEARLGPYEVGTVLGAGGTGEVYRARPQNWARVVAMKVSRQHLSSSPDFHQHKSRHVSIERPHICMLDDVGCDESLADGTRLKLHSA